MKWGICLVLFFLLIANVSAYTANLKIETDYPLTGLIVDVIHPEEGYVIDQFYTETDVLGSAYFSYENDDYDSAGFRVNILNGEEVVDAKEFLEPFKFDSEIILSLSEPLVVVPEPSIPSSGDRYTPPSDDSVVSKSPEPSEDTSLAESADSLTSFVVREIIGKPHMAAITIIVVIFLAWLAWTKRKRH